MCLTLGIGLPWVRSVPVERLVRAMLNYWRFLAKHLPQLSNAVMSILFILSTFDARLWLKIVQPEFEDLFFVLAVESLDEPARDAVWNSFQEFFSLSYMKAMATVNGNGVQNDSDAESQMDIDHPTKERDIPTFSWQVTINCLKRASTHIALAGKAFDSASSMFRYILR
jgi:hypothetical protein